MAGFSLIPIMFLTALAIDSTSAMSARRHAQNCCDAAALAGGIVIAQQQSLGNTPSQQAIQTAVNNALSQNNFTNGTNCTVSVNWPPQAGNFENSNSVEVKMTITHGNLVVFGSNTLAVRSVASCSPSSVPSFPMLILDPSSADAFWVTSGSLTMGTPTVQVNSTNANAAVVDGGGLGRQRHAPYGGRLFRVF